MGLNRPSDIRHHVDASKFVLPSLTVSLESSVRAKVQVSGTLEMLHNVVLGYRDTGSIHFAANVIISINAII